MNDMIVNDAAYAQKMDEQDSLRHYRDQFYIPMINGEESVYFTGNSLGLQPKITQEHILNELEDWANFGVEGHVHARNPWVSYHEQFPSLLKDIVGAKETEIVVMNQLTVNVHLLFTTFYMPDAKRWKIICEAKAFPSDQYAIESQVKLHGLNPAEAIIEVHPRPGEVTIHTEDILSAIAEHGDETALVFFGGVNYYTGQVFDMKAITAKAHEVGACCGFDLAHAVGNIPLRLHDWDADFACWCSYKYLNSGPGSVAGVYIHERFHTSDLPRLAGWWGHDKASRFAMGPEFSPIPTAEGWQLSNAPIFSMAAHKASLEIFRDAGMEALFEKSKLLSKYLLNTLHAINEGLDQPLLQIITPSAENEHGCQVSLLMLRDGKHIFEALKTAGILADWREPDVIRIAPVPLYNSFYDIYRFGQVLSNMSQHA